MFLGDVKLTESNKFKKINKFLEKNYGVSLSQDVSHAELVSLRESITQTISSLRHNNVSAKSPEMAKAILMAEGVDALLEMHREANPNTLSSSYNNVLNTMFKHAARELESGDDIFDAVSSTMKKYRSSPYRFNDEEIEEDLRQRLLHYLNSGGDEMMLNDAYDWSSLHPEQKQAADSYLKDRGSELATLELEPMGDDPAHGRVTYQHPSLRNQDRMKESITKLKENEVEQAEVVIAAKGFGQELQSMVEKLGRLMNEDLGSVSDQMRQTYGASTAAKFQSEMITDFNSIIDLLRSTKERIDDAVDMLSTGQSYTDMDGIETPALGNDMDADLEIGDDLGLGGMSDPFGGDDAAAGDGAPLGREMKESRTAKLKQLHEHMTQLQKSIDKIKESSKSKKN